MINNLHNPDALNAAAIRLLGNRAYFIQRGGSGIFAIGHMLSPTLNKERTTRDIMWAPYGKREVAKRVTQGITKVMEFQTQTTGDLAVRALHAGDLAALAALGGVATQAWAATTALTATAYVRPTAQNGFYYDVTTAGTTGATEPEWPTQAGATVTDGTVTFTARALGSDPDGGTFLVQHWEDTADGMLIIVWDSAEGEAETSEIDVFPNVQLLGEGKPQGGDGENETLLAWQAPILSPASGYTLPESFNQATERTASQVTVLNVARNDVDALINDLVTQAQA